MFILNFDPKRVTRILFDLQAEHSFDKTCYEDVKYQIGFILTLIFEGGISFFTFDLIYRPGPPGVEFLIRTQFRRALAQ